ncbi:hypothetical protein F5Y07DRAFT_154159 [Xylaria sp. FL0933]|nr:hypothetical protein F5Y07DRAFT_154159 [Xylaria sp. FL0933]
MAFPQNSRHTLDQGALALQSSSERVDMGGEDIRSQEPSTALLKREGRSKPTYAKRGWRPSYLQRRVLLCSILLCVSLIVAVEVLFWYSSKHRGLRKSDNSLHYLWTYGPTAILTAIGAIWTRIDYQAKVTAPWNRLARGPAAAKKTLLLDYLDPLPPVSIFNAVNNGDFGVAAAAIIALLWSLIIAFSASLINLTPTDNQPISVPVDITTGFKNDLAGLENARSLSYYNMLGLQEANLTFPDGVSGKYSYQKFNGRDIPSTAELHATIDGFSASLVCEEASYHVYQGSYVDTGLPLLNFTMATDGCEITSSWIGPPLRPEVDLYYSRFGSGSCQNSSDLDHQRIAVSFGKLNYGAPAAEIPFPGSPVEVNTSLDVNLLCRPTYMISKVDAVKNGSEILSVTPSLSTQPTALSNIHAWDITRALFRSFNNPITVSYLKDDGLLIDSQSFNASDTVIDVDPMMYLVLGQLSTPPPSSSTLRNASLLQNLTTQYYQMHTLFIAKDLLTEPISLEAIGQTILYQERLIVSGTAAHAMAGILAAIVLLFVIITITTPKTSVLACAPSSISGVAKLASRSDAVIQRLKNSGGANSETLAARLDNSNYMTSVQDGDTIHQGYLWIAGTGSTALEANTESKNAPLINPTTLQPWTRSSVALLVLGITITLEITLTISQRSHGIGAVPIGPSYLHYSWTTVPALIFTIVGLIYGSMDLNIRKLTPYVNLSQGSTFRRSLGLDLLDLSIPRILLRETRTKNFAALCSTLATLIASLLATFSSSLFVLSDISAYTNVQLHVGKNLELPSTFDRYETSLLTSSLILESNLSYPAFTYENLVFPSLYLFSENGSGHDITLDAVVAAVRPRMDCRLHNESSISPYFEDNRLTMNITDAACSPPKDVLQIITNYPSPAGYMTGLLAGTTNAYCTNDDPKAPRKSAYDWAYFWADIKVAPDPTVVSISALLCNESYENVDVFTSFVSTDLEIDLKKPPIPDEATAKKNSTLWEDREEVYFYFPNGPSAQVEGFFNTLTTSRYAIPQEYLADTSKAEIGQDAIIWQHSILRAQVMNSNSRVTPEAKNSSTRASEKNIATSYKANMTEAVGQVRVVQDVASTRILQTLLAIVLILSLVSWALMPRTKILPREPTNLASVIALLVDGNLFEVLPITSQLMDEAATERLFNGVIFKMGWVEFIGQEEESRPGGNEANFAIYWLYQEKQVKRSRKVTLRDYTE